MSSIPILFYSNNQSVAKTYVLDTLKETFQNSLGRFKLYKDDYVEKSIYTFLDPMFFPISTLDALKPVLCLVCLCVSNNDNADYLQNTIVKHFMEQIKRMPSHVNVFIISYNHSDGSIARVNKQAKKLYSQMSNHHQPNLQLNLIDGEQKCISNQVFLNFHEDLKKLFTSKLYDTEKIMNQTQLNNICQLMLNKINYFIMCAYVFKKETVVREILSFFKMFLKLDSDNDDKNKYKDFKQRTMDTKQVVMPIYETFYHLLGIYQEYVGDKSQFMVKQALNQDVIQQVYQFQFTKQDFYNNLGSSLLLPMSAYQQKKEFNQQQINDQQNAIELVFGQLKHDQYSCYQIVAYLANILFTSSVLSCNEIDDIFEQLIMKPFFGDKVKSLHMQFMWIDLILNYNSDKQVQYKYMLKRLHCQIYILDMFSPLTLNYQNLYMEFKQECKQFLLQKYAKNNKIMTEQLELFTQVFLVEQLYQEQFLQTEKGQQMLSENQIYQFFISRSFCKTFLTDNLFDEQLERNVKQKIVKQCDILQICQFIQTLLGTQNHSIFTSLSAIFVELGLQAIKQLTNLCKEQVESNHPIDLQLKCLQALVEMMDKYLQLHPEVFTKDQIRYIQCQCFAVGIISKSIINILFGSNSLKESKRNYNIQNELNFIQLTSNWLYTEKIFLDQAEVFQYQFNNHQNIHFSVSLDVKYLHIVLAYNLADIQFIYQQYSNQQTTKNDIMLLNDYVMPLEPTWPFKYIKAIFRQADNDPNKDRIIIKKHDSPIVKLPYQITDETENLEQLDSYFYLHLIGVSSDKENWFVVYHVDIYPSQMKSITEYIKRQSQSDETILNESIVIKQTQEISTRTSVDLKKYTLQPLIINMIPYQNNINAKLVNQEIYYNTEQNIIFQIRISHPSQMQITFQLSENINQIGTIYFLERQPKNVQSVSQRPSDASGQDSKLLDTAEVNKEVKIIEYKENQRIFLQKLFYIVIPVYVINDNLSSPVFESQAQPDQYYIIIKSDNQKRVCQQKFSLKPEFLFQTQFSLLFDEYQIQLQNMTGNSFQNAHIILEQDQLIKNENINIPQHCSYFMEIPIKNITNMSLIIDLESFIFKDSSLFCNSFIYEDQLHKLQLHNSNTLNSLQLDLEQKISDESSDLEELKRAQNESLLKAIPTYNLAKASILLLDNFTSDMISQMQLPEIVMRLEQWVIQKFTIIRRQNCQIIRNSYTIRMIINQKYNIQYKIINSEQTEVIIKLQNEDNFIVYGPTRLQIQPGEYVLDLDIIPIRTGQMSLPYYQLEEPQFTLHGITQKKDVKVYTTW